MLEGSTGMRSAESAFLPSAGPWDTENLSPKIEGLRWCFRQSRRIIEPSKLAQTGKGPHRSGSLSDPSVLLHRLTGAVASMPEPLRDNQPFPRWHKK